MKQKERHLLITAKSKDGVSHGIPYPMPLLNPVWVCVEAIINAHKSGKVEIMIHNTAEPIAVTDEILSKFLDYGYINKETTKPVEKVPVTPIIPPKVEIPEVKEEKVEEVIEPEKKDEEVVEENTTVVPEEKKFRKNK